MTFDYLQKASEKNTIQWIQQNCDQTELNSKETFILLENLMKIQSDYSHWMNFVGNFLNTKKIYTLRYDTNTMKMVKIVCLEITINGLEQRNYAV